MLQKISINCGNRNNYFVKNFLYKNIYKYIYKKYTYINIYNYVQNIFIYIHIYFLFCKINLVQEK